MSKLSTAVLMFIGYWLAALTVLGLVSIIHGDCWIAPGGHAAQEQCVVEKRRLGLTGLAVAGAGYVILVYRSRRRNR